MRAYTITATVLGTALALATTFAGAQDGAVGGRVGEMTMTADDAALFQRRDFSPYAGRAFPT